MNNPPSHSSPRMAQGLIFSIVCIDLLGFAIVLPLLPRYGEYYQASELTLGLLMASFSAMQFLFAPIWGRLSDGVGRRPILLLGLAGSVVFYTFFGLASLLPVGETWAGLGALAWLFLTRIGAGIAGATIPTAQAYISDTTTEKERGSGMALIGAAFGVGFTFGPLIGAGFVSSEINSTPSAMPGFIAAGISGVALLIAIFKLPESLHPDAKPSRANWMDIQELKSASQRPGIGFVLLTLFVSTVAFAQFESTLSLLTKRLDFSDRGNFFIFAYIGLTLALIQGGIIRRLLPRIGELRMGITGCIFQAVGLLLIGYAGTERSLWMLWTFLPVVVFGFSAITPSLYSLLSLRSSESDQGGILGLGQSISALARIVGPVIGLMLFTDDHIYRPYWCGSGLLMICLVLMLWVGSTLASKEIDVISTEAAGSAD